VWVELGRTSYWGATGEPPLGLRQVLAALVGCPVTGVYLGSCVSVGSTKDDKHSLLPAVQTALLQAQLVAGRVGEPCAELDVRQSPNVSAHRIRTSPSVRVLCRRSATHAVQCRFPSPARRCFWRTT
jgi:hypothetical protein